MSACGWKGMLAGVAGGLAMACSDAPGPAGSASSGNHLVQWGAANPTYLQARIAAGEVIDFGGTGVAAVDGGEAILFDGKALVTDSTGQVRDLSPEDTIIISGVVSNFQASVTGSTSSAIGCADDLDAYLDDLAGDANVDRLATFTIRGTFASISYALDDGISEDAEILTITDAEGTMVGIKSPYYFGDASWSVGSVTVGIGEYPFHVHFVTDDGAIAGHVRDCEIDAGDRVDLGLVDVFDLRMNYGG